MRHSMSPGLVSMLGLPTPGGAGMGGAGVGGATPPLLYNAAAGPSPFGDPAGGAGGSPAARLRHAAASFGLPSIMRKRARFTTTPASAAAAGGAGGDAAGRSAGTAAAVRVAQASMAAAQAGPTPGARLTASAMGAAYMNTGGVGHPSDSPSSPMDMELARALFVSPPPMRAAAGTGPRSATRSRTAAAAAGDVGGLSSPFASAAFWNESRLAAGAEQRAAAAAANAAAAAAANAAAAAAGNGLQRGNARVSSIFRREPASRAGAGVAPKAADALEVMRRVEFAAADVFSKAEAVLARSPAGDARVPSARRGAAAYQHSAALVKELHGGARAPPMTSFSPFSAADGGAFSPLVGGAGDALLALSPSTFLRA
jgi:SWI/SNF-related matrix-associated actin-dependent regulator 1 of chromatin subfamily A